jgi:hypothetical protein
MRWVRRSQPKYRRNEAAARAIVRFERRLVASDAT